MVLAQVEAWLAARGGAARGAIAVCTGAALALGHAPFDLPWIWIVGFPFLVLIAAMAPRSAVMCWLAGTGYFAAALHWIVEPFLVDIARHGWMAPFALVFMAAGLALFWGVAGWLAGWLSRRGVAFWAALPLTLSLAEFARARVMTGFPWAHPGFVWVDTPLAQVAAWVGPHGLGLLVMVCLAALAGRGTAVKVLGVVALVLLFGWGALWSGSIDKGNPLAPVIRIVQPNAAQHLKWRPDMMQEFYGRLIAQTSAPGERPLALVVWPETAVPFLLDERPELQADISTAAGGVPVVLGIRRYQDGWYNSLAVLGQQGDVLAAYDKHHLVPFGEYFPLRGLVGAIGLGAVADGLVGSFTAGDGQAVIEVPGVPAFQPLICYEVIFPHEIGGAGRPEFLLQVTNDAWFGNFSGPYQHLAQARMRAIEQGLPLVRSANTGISAMIDAQGRVKAQIGLGEAGFVDVPLPQPKRSTPYVRWGDSIYLGLLALLAVGMAAARRRG